MHGFDAPKRSLYTNVEAEPHRLSFCNLITLTVCFLGVQFGWAIQIAYTTPIFLELGVPHSLVSLIWIAGPISGLIVQPVVGAVSDSLRSKYGRRRPFIFFGAMFIVLGLALISNAVDIGRVLGDPADRHDRAIIVAIIGFWILDLSNNTVQGPCRALLVDVAPADQQGLGGAVFSFMLGLGNLLGYLTGYVNLTKYLPFMKTEVRALFTISMCILVTCIGITVSTTKERAFVAKGPIENPFKLILTGVKNMPPVVSRVCAVQFFVWVGWFTYLVYITDWVGEQIYGGDPHADEGTEARKLFDHGVSQASLALTYNAVVTMVFSACLPKLISLLGIKLVYFIGNMVLCVCLTSTIFIHSNVFASIAIACFGIPWSVTMVLPFTIIGQGVDVSQSGLYMGALNIFVVLPQLVVSVSIGFVITLFHHNIASAFVVGGVSALIGALLVFRLVITNPVQEILEPSYDKFPREDTLYSPIKDSNNGYSTLN